jgi:ornithine cyclodeaminase
MLLLSEENQKKLLDIEDILECTEHALKQYSEGKAINPTRMSLPFYDDTNTLLAMPSVLNETKESGNVGIKIVTTAPENTKVGKKTINGLVMVADYQTGEPVCLLDAAYLTKIRTGALSAVATKYLSNPSAERLAIIGTGVQAYGLLETISHVRNIKELYLYNRSAEKAEVFSKHVKSNFDYSVEICNTPEEAANNADILVTASSSREPVFSGPLKKGLHINAVGSFRPSMQELPSNIFPDIDKIVVESKHDALEETGDLINPLNEGVIDENSIYDELGNLVGADGTVREHKEEITLFKSVGLGLVDVIIADYFYRKAREAGEGTEINF